MTTKIKGSRQIQDETVGPDQLTNTAVTPGVYGDATHAPQVTVDADGRITAASEVAISGAALTVQEQDGAPAVANVTTIKVTNGTLTDDGGGIVSLSTGGGGVSDGDKGDITVSASGATWTIDNGVVSNAKLADVATDTIKGRATAATGAPEDLTALPFAFTGDVTRPADSNAQTIANNAVTFAKMQDIATDSLIGRDTAASGDPENITLDDTLEMTGAGVLQRAALTGDVTAAAGGNATTIANDAVTYAKMQNVSAESKLLGRGAGAGAGDPQEITLGTNLTMSGTTLNAGGTAVDSDAIHDNVAGEISAITEKVTPVDADLIIIEDSAAANAKKKVQIGNLPGGGTAFGQVLSYPTTFAGDTINGSSATPFVDVSAFDTKEVLNSRILHLKTLGASKDQRVRVTLGTTKAAAFDVTVCCGFNGAIWSADADTYLEVRLSTSADAQLAIARLFGSTQGLSADYRTQILRVGGSGALATANQYPFIQQGSGVALTLRFVRDGSNVISYYVGLGTAPMFLGAIIKQSDDTPYTNTVAGTLERIEFSIHTPSGPGASAQWDAYVDYLMSQ